MNCSFVAKARDRVLLHIETITTRPWHLSVSAPVCLSVVLFGCTLEYLSIYMYVCLCF